ncbi:phage baseplate assembly protein V [Sorangium sp. So ce1128]
MQAGKQFGTMIGVVTARNDKLRLGRVKVRYPTLGDIESEWARVLVPYGGAGHGFKAIPEVGDEVVVGFIEGDPKLPIILGSLYSEKNAPPLRQDNDVRVLESPGNHRITLSDAPRPGGKITLESGDVRLGGENSIHPAVLGDALQQFLAQLLTSLSSHTHTSLPTGGPTSPPVPPVFLPLQARLASLLSRIVKIEG